MPLAVLRVLVVALALVIPIQGIAAVTAGICAALGHHETSHDTSTAAVHDHAATHEPDDQVPEPNAGSAHCPPCVACCAAAAIASSARVFIPDPPAAAAMAAVSLFFPGIQPDRLDRPPLSL